MKIVMLPGVGVQEDTDKYEKFLDKFRTKFQCEAEVFVWEHGLLYPVHNLPLKKTRDWIVEVMMDFEKVVTGSSEVKVPDADIYIGHSAGSIIALAQEGKPSIIMGSPAAVVECIPGFKLDNISFYQMMKGDRPILNIINRYDILAYPLEYFNVDNYEYTGNCLNPFSFFPLYAHINYWKAKEVSEKIIDTISQWEDEKIV